jgi:MoxR-like ATPase
MNEGQATIDGVTYELPRPFFVLATQNPADHQGTYPLPEAQLDRFLLRLSIGYPSLDDELKMLYSHQTSTPVDEITPIADGAALLEIQSQIRALTVQENVARYLLRLIDQTRKHEDLEIGVSPRGAIAFFRAVQAKAYLSHRSYVSPADIQALALPILAHRIRLTAQARYSGATSESAIGSILSSIAVPT